MYKSYLHTVNKKNIYNGKWYAQNMGGLWGGLYLGAAKAFDWADIDGGGTEWGERTQNTTTLNK